MYFVGIGDLGAELNDARGRNVGLWRVPFAGGTPVRVTDAETIDLDDGRTRPLMVSAQDVLGATLDRGAIRLVSIGNDGATTELIGGPRCVIDYDRAGDVIVGLRHQCHERRRGDRAARRRRDEADGFREPATGLRPMTEISATRRTAIRCMAG